MVMPPIVDLAGLLCPQVVLELKRHIDSCPPGTRLDVISTDPLSRIDIPLFLRKAGHELISERADGERLIFAISTRMER